MAALLCLCRYRDLLLTLECIMRKGHSRVELEQLEVDLTKVLARAEILLPLFWCTGVRHQLLHACRVIKLCGPFFAHNMLVFERWHTIFKRMVRGRKNVLASLHAHWSMVLAAAAWRLPSDGGEDWEEAGVHGFSCSLAAAKEVDYDNVSYEPKWGQTKCIMGDVVYREVQELYESRFTDYASLRKKYQTLLREVRSHRTSHLPPDAATFFINRRKWNALNEDQQKFCRMTSAAKTITRAENKVGAKFCTEAYCKDFLFDNSVVKYIWRDRENHSADTVAYARIKQLYLHEMWPGTCV